MSNGAARKFDSEGPAFARLRPPLGEAVHRALALARRALPQACALCGEPCGDAMLCAPCMNTLPALGPGCPVCASPSPTANVCGVCLRRPPRFAATIAACRYAFPLDRLVQALKYRHQLALAQPLGDALAAALLRVPRRDAWPEAIVPLPLAAARQRQRGFNQAMEIARVVSRRTGRPLARGLVRTGAGAAQASLPWSKRRRNVKGVFACNVSFAGRSVAVVDDVMTTGATLDAAAAALIKAGAARVEAWVVARTLAPGDR